VHGRQVPDVEDQGPAGHHPQQVTDHAVLGTVPESVSELWVVLRENKWKCSEDVRFETERSGRTPGRGIP